MAGVIGLSFKKVYGMGQDNPKNDRCNWSGGVYVFELSALTGMTGVLSALAVASFFNDPISNAIQRELDTPLSWGLRTDVNPLQQIVGVVLLILFNVGMLPLAVPYWLYAGCAGICGVAASVFWFVRLLRSD